MCCVDYRKILIHNIYEVFESVKLKRILVASITNYLTKKQHFEL